MTEADKSILAGLFLSKFDAHGLRQLGFDSFTEAFNVLGYAIGSPPSSIKNYRDEFDPLFSNPRKGWHKRPRRENCLKILERYKDIDIELFTSLIKSFGEQHENDWSEVQPKEDNIDNNNQFVSRLITGIAAENYFEQVAAGLTEFRNCSVANTTRLGCGYDFRLQPATSVDFLAVEVKGIKGRQGAVSLTPKEHAVAMRLRERFFLFIVKNFEESPFHVIFQNPLSSDLEFRRTERKMVQISWMTNI